jgi:hypothetical protein
MADTEEVAEATAADITAVEVTTEEATTGVVGITVDLAAGKAAGVQAGTVQATGASRRTPSSS